MTWYYASSGQQQGPVDDAALDDLILRGVVRQDTLVWRAGMPGWQVLSVARPRPAATPAAGISPAATAPAAAASQSSATGAAPTPAASGSAAPVAGPAQPGAETRYCSECGRPFPTSQLYQLGGAAVCSSCYPVYMQRMSAQPVQVSGYAWRYAGFWIRFLARVIDAIIVGFVSFIIRIPLAFLMGGGALVSLGGDQSPTAALAALPMIMALAGISFLIQVALGAAYEGYFLSSRGATPGKMVLGLKVVRADGGPLSPGLAVGRFFALYLSAFILLIGFIMAAFDPEKRALHDRVCNTRVIHSS